MRDAWPAQRPLVVAHRGLAPGRRENTVAGARTAFAAGADAIEVDVRCTADRVPVLHHDRELGGLAVAETSRDRLAARARRLGYELATVADLLDKLPASALVNLEIKDPAATEPVLELLDLDRQPPALVTAFEPRVVREVRRRAPKLPTGLILGRRRAYRLLFSRRRERRLASWVAELAPDALVLHRSFLRLGLAGTAFGLELPVLVYTVNRGGRLRRAMRHPLLWGVITDRPAAAHRARGLVHPRPGDRSPTRKGIEGPSNGSQQPG